MVPKSDTGIFDVFISYAREDLPRAEAMARMLGAEGLSVWWDRQLLAGQEWSPVIEKELDTARCVVVLWSPQAKESRFVRDEATRALDRGVYVPVLLEACDPPLGFRQVQAEDLAGWAGEREHPGVKRLLESIQAKRGAPIPPPDPSRGTSAPFRLRPHYEDVDRWWKKGLCFWNLTGADASAPDALGKATRVLLVGLLVSLAIDAFIMFLNLPKLPGLLVFGFPLFLIFLLLRVAVFATALHVALRMVGLRVGLAAVYVLVAYTLSATMPLIHLLFGEQVAEALRMFGTQGMIGPHYLHEATLRLLLDQDATTFASVRWWLSVVLGLALSIAFAGINLPRVLVEASEGRYRVPRVATAMAFALVLAYLASRYVIGRLYWLTLARVFGE